MTARRPTWSEEHQDKWTRMIITNGVFSMDGNLAKLNDIVASAERCNAMVFVDDSHATASSARRAPAPTHCGVFNKVDVVTTRLGKASGACVRDVAKWYRSAASERVLIYSQMP